MIPSIYSCSTRSLIVILEKAIGIFLFLWNGYEFLARNTLRLPREKGAINIVNIRLKIASIQLAQISKIVHNSVSSGWVQFGHIWLGLRLTRFSDYTFSNAVPHHSEDLPPYYQSLSSMLTKILNGHPSIAMIKGAKCKFFYSELCKKYQSRP